MSLFPAHRRVDSYPGVNLKSHEPRKSRWKIPILLVAIAIGAIGVAMVSPLQAAAHPSAAPTAGFVGFTTIVPKCGESDSYGFSGIRVEEDATRPVAPRYLILQRLIEIEEDVWAWIDVTGDGVAVEKNGQSIDTDTGAVWAMPNDTFTVLHNGDNMGAVTYRVLLQDGGSPAVVWVDRQDILFPSISACAEMEPSQQPAS